MRVSPTRGCSQSRAPDHTPLFLHRSASFADLSLEAQYRSYYCQRIWQVQLAWLYASPATALVAIFGAALSRVVHGKHYIVAAAGVLLNLIIVQLCRIADRRGITHSFVAAQALLAVLALAGSCSGLLAIIALESSESVVVLLMAWHATMCFIVALNTLTFRVTCKAYGVYCVLWSITTFAALRRRRGYGHLEFRTPNDVDEVVISCALFTLTASMPLSCILSFVMERSSRRRWAHRQQMQKDLDAVRSALEQQQAAALRVHEDTLSAAAHDLRTPILATWHCTAQLQADMAAKERGLHKSLEKVRTCLAVAQHTVDNIVGVCKGCDPTEPPACTCTLRALIERAVFISSKGGVNTASRSRRSMIIEMGTAAPRLLLPEVSVMRMLINIVSNALKYTPSTCSVTVRVNVYKSNELEHFRSQGGYCNAPAAVLPAQGLFLLVQVVDAGCGVPDNMKAALFKMRTRFLPHEQASMTEGLGIGLASVAKLSAALAGMCGVRDNNEHTAVQQQLEEAAQTSPSRGAPTSPQMPFVSPIVGANFWFAVPTSFAKASSEPPCDASDHGSKLSLLPCKRPLRSPPTCPNVCGDAPTVLLVEDTEMVRDILAHRLQEAGCDVSCACSGEVALGILRQRRFDCVFCDQMMPPGIDGLETVRRLRAYEAAQHLQTAAQPVYLLTAHSTETSLVAQSQNLVHGVIDKLTPVETLVQLVTQVRGDIPIVGMACDDDSNGAVEAT